MRQINITKLIQGQMTHEIKTYSKVDLTKLQQLERVTAVYNIVKTRLRLHPEERREVRYKRPDDTEGSYPIDARFNFGVWFVQKHLLDELQDSNCTEAAIIAMRRGKDLAREMSIKGDTHGTEEG